jgi:C4-dicarboxylate-specific signal transduction histidine kinase
MKIPHSTENTFYTPTKNTFYTSRCMGIRASIRRLRILPLINILSCRVFVFFFRRSGRRKIRLRHAQQFQLHTHTHTHTHTQHNTHTHIHSHTHSLTHFSSHARACNSAVDTGEHISNTLATHQQHTPRNSGVDTGASSAYTAPLDILRRWIFN